MTSKTDHHDLVRQLKNGDEKAVDRLVELYGDRLYMAACVMCRNPADAQDLKAETISRAVRSIGAFRGESSLFTWLYGILSNLGRMSARKSSRSRVICMKQLPEIADDCPAVGQNLDKETVSACLAVAMRQLPEAHRDVVLLRFYGELGIHEIAVELNLNPGTVKSRLFNAMRQMRNLLPKEMNLLLSAGN